MLFFFILQILIAFTSKSLANVLPDLPNNLPRCSIDDPKMGECILNAAYTLKPRFQNGIDELGIPSYDPLFLPYFTVGQESDMLNFTSVLHNFTIRGLDNYDITNIQYNPKSMTFTGKLNFDPLSMHTVYEVDGQLLFIPVNGSGNAQISLGPINGTFEITGEMMKLNTEDHYNPKDLKIKLTIDELGLYLHGLFNGNVELETMTNELLNRNSKMLIDALTPAIEKLSETFIMRYFKWLTKTYPYYKLFPHSGQM